MATFHAAGPVRIILPARTLATEIAGCPIVIDSLPWLEDTILLGFGNPIALVPPNILYAPGNIGDQHRLLLKNGKLP